MALVGCRDCVALDAKGVWIISPGDAYFKENWCTFIWPLLLSYYPGGCTCFLIPGSFTVLLYCFAFLLYSGAHWLVLLAKEFKGVVSWLWQRQYICAHCLYTLKSRDDRSEIFIYKHYTSMCMYMVNWVLFLLVQMQSTPPVTSDF